MNESQTNSTSNRFYVFNLVVHNFGFPLSFTEWRHWSHLPSYAITRHYNENNERQMVTFLFLTYSIHTCIYWVNYAIHPTTHVTINYTSSSEFLIFVNFYHVYWNYDAANIKTNFLLQMFFFPCSFESSWISQKMHS